MRKVLLLFGAPLFIVAVILYAYVYFKLKPRQEDLDDVYVEFEEDQEAYARYIMWYRRTLWLGSLALLMLFIGIML